MQVESKLKNKLTFINVFKFLFECTQLVVFFVKSSSLVLAVLEVKLSRNGSTSGIVHYNLDSTFRFRYFSNSS